MKLDKVTIEKHIDKNFLTLRDIENCKYINNIDAIKGFPDITYLSISGTAIATLDFVEYLPKLNCLHLRDTNVTSIELLKKCSNLEEILINESNIKDIYLIKDLPDVTVKMSNSQRLVYLFQEMLYNKLIDNDIQQGFSLVEQLLSCGDKTSNDFNYFGLSVLTLNSNENPKELMSDFADITKKIPIIDYLNLIKTNKEYERYCSSYDIDYDILYRETLTEQQEQAYNEEILRSGDVTYWKHVGKLDHVLIYKVNSDGVVVMRLWYICSNAIFQKTPCLAEITQFGFDTYSKELAYPYSFETTKKITADEFMEHYNFAQQILDGYINDNPLYCLVGGHNINVRHFEATNYFKYWKNENHCPLLKCCKPR